MLWKNWLVTDELLRLFACLLNDSLAVHLKLDVTNEINVDSSYWKPCHVNEQAKVSSRLCTRLLKVRYDKQSMVYIL